MKKEKDNDNIASSSWHFRLETSVDLDFCSADYFFTASFTGIRVTTLIAKQTKVFC